MRFFLPNWQLGVLSENVQKQRFCLIYLVLYKLLILNSVILVAFFIAELAIRGVVLKIFGCVFFAELAIRGVVLKIFGCAFFCRIGN